MTEAFWLNLADNHAALLPLVIGIIAFLESLAFVGITVPGIALMFALTALAGSQALPLPPMLAAAFIGALLGDQLSFLLGRFATPWLQQRWPLRRYPQWQERGVGFFDRYGAFSVIIGRFVGPLRPLIPFVAGSCHMSPTRFSLFNIFSALAWSPSYLLPGYLAGMGAQKLPLIEGPAVELLIAVLALMIAFQQFHMRLHPEAGLWNWLQQRRIDPQRLGVLLFLGGCILLLLLSIAAQLSGQFQSINELIYNALFGAGQHAPLVGSFLTHLGDPSLVLSLAVAIGLLAQLRYRTLVGWGIALGTLCAIVFNHLLKESLRVARPEAGQALLESYSFPSGHASASAAFYALVAVWLLHGQIHRLRHIGYLLAATLVWAIALSRTLLGVHWPLDILAGVSEGVAIAGLYRYWLLKHSPEQPLTVAPILTLLLLSALTYSAVRTFLT